MPVTCDGEEASSVTAVISSLFNGALVTTETTDRVTTKTRAIAAEIDVK